MAAAASRWIANRQKNQYPPDVDFIDEFPIPAADGGQLHGSRGKTWLARSRPPRLLLLKLLLAPALGAQLLVAHGTAEALTGAQLCPAT